MKDKLHPCQKCGACCSIFRVSFVVGEAAKDQFNVPEEYTVRISDELLALKFKNPNKKRCQALQGHIGQQVGCEIYENRPSPCRNFKASYEDGLKNVRCDQARSAMGLSPLTPEAWTSEAANDISY